MERHEIVERLGELKQAKESQNRISEYQQSALDDICERCSDSEINEKCYMHYLHFFFF